MALGVALLSLVFAVMIMARNETGHITTSFSDTVILTRNVGDEVSAGAKLRLKVAENGKLEYSRHLLNPYPSVDGSEYGFSGFMGFGRLAKK